MMSTVDLVEHSNWRIMRLDDVGRWGSGGTPKRGVPGYYGGDIPWLKIRDLDDGPVTSAEENITEEGLKNSSAKIVEPGTFLIAMYGSIGKLGISKIRCATNQAIAFCVPDEQLATTEYLFELLLHFRPALIAQGKGGNQANISQTVLKGLEVPIPPLEVQHSLVRVLRATRLHAISSSVHLHSACKAIERFRQAILAAACSGHLTADWREVHQNAQSVETALARLAAGKKRQSSSDESVDLPMSELPESYILGTIAAAAVLIEYGTSQRSEVGIDGIPVLRMGNIQNGSLDLSDLKYCVAGREIDKLMLQDGDLLFNRTNSPELVGKTAVFHQDARMTFASYLIRVRFDADVADPDFVSYWINSAWGKAWARHVKTDGVSQSNINGTKLGAMPLPLPPIEEQREIVRRASKMLQLADNLLAQIQSVLRCVDRSSQAVLAKAFRGELHTNDVSESAEVL